MIITRSDLHESRSCWPKGMGASAARCVSRGRLIRPAKYVSSSSISNSSRCVICANTGCTNSSPEMRSVTSHYRCFKGMISSARGAESNSPPKSMYRFSTPGHAESIMAVSFALVPCSIKLRTDLRRTFCVVCVIRVNISTLHLGRPSIAVALMMRVEARS